MTVNHFFVMQTVKENSLFDKIPTHDSKPPLPEYYP